MNKTLRVLFVMAVTGSGAAFAQEPVTPPSLPPAAAPSLAAPEQVPAPPAAAMQAPEPQQAQPVQVVAPDAGHWVYTSQYGWVWMPYAQGYTYVPDSGDPYMYVYYPSYGWRWVVAPWIFGWGPRPYWGTWGVSHFAWYSHPWFSGHASRGYGAYRPSSGYRGYSGRPYGGTGPGVHANSGSGYRGTPAAIPSTHRTGTVHAAAPAGRGGSSGGRGGGRGHR